MGFDNITVEGQPAGVVRVTLNRPAVRNALNRELIRELLEAVRDTERLEGARCLVLRGAGSVFCAGGDIPWLRAGGAGDLDANLREIQDLVLLLKSLNELPLPVIAVVQGAAIGGGLGLVAVADVALCSAETVFSLSEARLGLVPSCISPFVLEKIGPSWTRRYMVTGERFDAPAARSLGLVHEIAPSPASLDEALARIVASIQDCAPQALAATKAMLHRLSWPETRAGIGDWEAYAAEIFARSRAAAEAREGLAAFLEKRPPDWQNHPG